MLMGMEVVRAVRILPKQMVGDNLPCTPPLFAAIRPPFLILWHPRRAVVEMHGSWRPAP